MNENELILLDARCFEALDGPRDQVVAELRALAAAGSKLAAQWLAETDGMASHEWQDWLESEPV